MTTSNRKALHAELAKNLQETHLQEFGYTPAYTLYILEKLANREIHVDGASRNDARWSRSALQTLQQKPKTAQRFCRLLSQVFTDDNDYHARSTAILETVRRFHGEGKKGL